MKDMYMRDLRHGRSLFSIFGSQTLHKVLTQQATAFH